MSLLFTYIKQKSDYSNKKYDILVIWLSFMWISHDFCFPDHDADPDQPHCFDPRDGNLGRDLSLSLDVCLSLA